MIFRMSNTPTLDLEEHFSLEIDRFFGAKIKEEKKKGGGCG